MASRTSRKNAKTQGAGVPKAVLEKQKKLIPLRLAQVRGSRSQRSFARELGVFQQNVNRYESGTTPHADFLITLAVREGISLDWLLMGKGRSKK
jgi:transcriptional regulator with XRE-family HTH domain